MRKLYHLRKSEIRFLKPIAGGYTQKETAKLLGMSESTASTHAVNICTQMNLTKITAAAILAMAMGYFTVHQVPFKFKNNSQKPALLIRPKTKTTKP